MDFTTTLAQTLTEKKRGGMLTYKRNIIIRQSEPRKDQVIGLVQHLEVYPELANERVGWTVYKVELECWVDGGKEGTV